MRKKKHHQLQGCFLEMRITEQYDQRHLTFKGTARMDKPYEIQKLFNIAQLKGLDLGFLKKDEGIFGKRNA